MSAMSIRLQRGINRYYISFISQVIANNTLLAQIAQIRKFGPRPLKIWIFFIFFYFVMPVLSMRLQQGINRYNIFFISRIIANNAFGAKCPSRPTLAALKKRFPLQLY